MRLFDADWLRTYERRRFHEQVSLIHVPELPSVPPPTTCWPLPSLCGKFVLCLARYPSARQASLRLCSGSGVRHQLAGSPAQPAESSSLDVADRTFTSSCSPPGLAATQLLSVTGRRTYARRGLAPPCSRTLSDAPMDAAGVGSRSSFAEGGLELDQASQQFSHRQHARYTSQRLQPAEKPKR